jgi:uncharacterized protein YbjT (DUF2867 family)
LLSETLAHIFKHIYIFKDIKMILVTGATGNNGMKIIKRLAARNDQVRAMVRNHDRASAIAVPNVEIVEGDFDRPETLLKALAGVERAFLLTESGHEGKIYDLTGSQALTHAEMAESLSAELDRQITFVDIPPQAMGEMLLGIGFPVWQADGLLEDYAHYRRGEATAIASGVQDAIGRNPRSFEDFAQDYAAMFR